MKTRYILNSGGLSNNIPGAKKFVAEMVKDFGQSPKILFCFFAEKRENWEGKVPDYAEGFKNWSPEGVTPQFELALPDKFEQQIKDTDILYIHGGDDQLIMWRLEKFKIPEIWTGKTVATNSAGTDALAESFWTCDWRQCMNGLGILPIKVIPHFDSEFGANDPRGPIDWSAAHEELENYGDKTLPIYALKEGEFKIIEVES